MTSKLTGTFVLLIIFQVCLSIQTETSSESSEESLDQMAENIQKYLGQKDADDVKKIVSEINSAKDSEQSVDGYIKLFELGIKAIANQYETDNSTTAATPIA